MNDRPRLRLPIFTALLLAATLAGCGGGGHQAAGNGAAATELVTPALDAARTSPPSNPGPMASSSTPTATQPQTDDAPTAAVHTASPYTGVYLGSDETDSSLSGVLWVYADGRIEGYVDDESQVAGVALARLVGQFAAGETQAKVDVLDTAGHVWGRLELNTNSQVATRKILATLHRTHGAVSNKLVFRRNAPASDLASCSSIAPEFLDFSDPHHPIHAHETMTALQLTSDGSTGALGVHGTIRLGYEHVVLQARLQPSGIAGLYRARITFAVSDRNGHPIVPRTELSGEAFATQEKDHSNPVLRFDCAHGAQRLHFVAIAQ